MKKFQLLILVCAFLLGCESKSQETQESLEPISSQQQINTDNYDTEQKTNEGYEDGEYCATIEYYNSATGNSSTYTLEVEVENGELIRINWPNGGWLDSSHFDPPEVDADGSCSFTTFDGKDYSIQIEGTGACVYSNSSPDDDNDDEQMENEESNESDEEELEDTSYKFDQYRFTDELYTYTCSNALNFNKQFLANKI